MPKVLLGLGSNFEAADNLGAALDSLLLRFADIALSPVFESAPLQASGPPYLNLVAAVTTEVPVGELRDWLKALEASVGRHREDLPSGAMPLDVDILTYGKVTGRSMGVELPRADILSAAHVLWPLAVLVPRDRHPVLQRSYAELWQDFDRGGQVIRPVDFTWHDRQISSAMRT